ncbi:MAG: metal ABC transporter permease [Leptospiraceae bacterium]|nr:metal ABC transporter permease [Leptospiraceae bacterium]MCB1171407.1 metal ABC transporter permease [Leptospiraceae bacterium]
MEAFFQSWDLFWQTYATGWLAAALLGICGIVVVLKDQIFLGAAVAQSSTVGVALALWIAAGLGLAREEPSFFWILESGAALFAAGAAILAPVLGGKRGLRLTLESVNGWVFLVSSALAILIVSEAPFGLTEVEQILSAGLLGSQQRELLLFGALLFLTLGLIAWFRHRLFLCLLDPDFARSIGLKAIKIEILSFLWVGLVIGLSLRIAGLVYTFGFLVLPAMAARELCRSPFRLLVVAPTFALICSGLGFFFASVLDVPMTHMAVFLAALGASGAFFWRRLQGWHFSS